MPREERLPTAGTVLCEGAAEPSSTMNPGHLEDGEVGEYCALLGLFCSAPPSTMMSEMGYCQMFAQFLILFAALQQVKQYKPTKSHI